MTETLYDKYVDATLRWWAMQFIVSVPHSLISNEGTYTGATEVAGPGSVARVGNAAVAH